MSNILLNGRIPFTGTGPLIGRKSLLLRLDKMEDIEKIIKKYLTKNAPRCNITHESFSFAC